MSLNSLDFLTKTALRCIHEVSLQKIRQNFPDYHQNYQLTGHFPDYHQNYQLTGHYQMTILENAALNIYGDYKIHLADFCPIFTRETTFVTSNLFSCTIHPPLLKRGLLYKKRICSQGSKFFPCRLDCFSGGRQKPF